MFAKRTERLTSSLVRDILAIAKAPGMISFAGGLPAAEALFNPYNFVASHSQLPDEIWQYGCTEGEPLLRERIAIHLNRLGLPCSAEQVLVVNGSQQGIDLAAKLLIDEGESVLCEAPTYLAALQVFRLFGARIQSLVQDADGVLPASVQAASPARCAYLAPTFQNPSAHCYSAQRRAALAQCFDRRSEVVFEDDPYRDLAFSGPAPAPLVSHLRSAHWICQGSFSKILAPGLRLGYLVAHPDLMPMLVRLKQAADLHSNRLSQYLVSEILAADVLGAHMQKILPLYRARRDAMHAALSRHLADLACWQLPQGGLFFWLTLNQACDTMALLQRALAQGLALMPGEAFYPEAPPRPCLRLNFSHADPEQIEAGVQILSKVLRSA